MANGARLAMNNEVDSDFRDQRVDPSDRVRLGTWDMFAGQALSQGPQIIGRLESKGRISDKDFDIFVDCSIGTVAIQIWGTGDDAHHLVIQPLYPGDRQNVLINLFPWRFLISQGRGVPGERLFIGFRVAARFRRD